MCKKNVILAWIFIAIFASFTAFYTTNLILFDVGNNTYGFQDLGIIVSLAGFIVTLDFVVLTIFIIRSLKNKNNMRQFVKTYSTIIAAFSLVGIVCSILTGTVFYSSLLAPYPFPGYGLICLIIHSLSLVASLLIRFYFVKKLPEDTETKKLTFKQVMKSIGYGLLFYFAYDRLGALLCAPIYVEPSTLYMTFLFYIYLTVPMMVVVYVSLFYFDITTDNSKGKIIFAIVIIALNLFTGLPTILIGWLNPLFVSTVSPAVGLERLASMPVVILIHFVGVTVFCIIRLVHAINYRKQKKA